MKTGSCHECSFNRSTLDIARVKEEKGALLRAARSLLWDSGSPCGRASQQSFSVVLLFPSTIAQQLPLLQLDLDFGGSFELFFPFRLLGLGEEKNNNWETVRELIASGSRSWWRNLWTALVLDSSLKLQVHRLPQHIPQSRKLRIRGTTLEPFKLSQVLSSKLRTPEELLHAEDCKRQGHPTLLLVSYQQLLTSFGL